MRNFIRTHAVLVGVIYQYDVWMVFLQNISVASTKSVKLSYGIINRFQHNKIPSSSHGTKATELANNFPTSSAAWIFITYSQVAATGSPSEPDDCRLIFSGMWYFAVQQKFYRFSVEAYHSTSKVVETLRNLYQNTRRRIS